MRIRFSDLLGPRQNYPLLQVINEAKARGFVHGVDLGYESAEAFLAIREWLDAEGFDYIMHRKVDLSIRVYTYRFLDDRAAMAFKLRWV